MKRVSRRLFLRLGILGVVGVGAYLLLRRWGINPPPRVDEAVRVSVETLASGLVVPWSMAFISGGEAVLTERGGRVSLLDVDTGRLSLLGELETAAVGEGGLLGVAVHTPGPRLYLYQTYRAEGRLLNRVVMYDSLELRDPLILVDGIPGAAVHDGGRVKIGPDGRLYVSTGDAAQPWLAQSIDSLAGKILRLRLDGRVPGDNPFPGSPVFSYGHRNVQGLAWRPGDNTLYATEHGPSGEMGLRAHDEINRITPGGNYGWPEVVGFGGRAGFIDPILESGDETWAPSGCSFYSGRNHDAWAGNLFFAALRGEHLHRVVLAEDGGSVVYHEMLFKGVYGRLRDVVEGPDGNLYILTSNRDGRGLPREGDDRVLRLSWSR
jgi:glucose/arabinose dehydrogenase